MKAITAAALAALAALAAPAHAKGCHERSYVVGYEHCSRFGTWSRDQDVIPFQFEYGWLHQDFMARPFTLRGEPVVRSATAGGDPSLATATDGVSVRYLGGGRLFYGGLEIDTGGLTTQPQFPGLPARGGSYNGLAIVGAHASLWRLAAGVELAAGGRYTGYSYCATKECAQYAGEGQGVVEARVRAEMFVAPRWSVGVGYGHSAIGAGDQSFMVYTGLHLRALDGMY